jgi:hypothetical protein
MVPYQEMLTPSTLQHNNPHMRLLCSDTCLKWQDINEAQLLTVLPTGESMP